MLLIATFSVAAAFLVPKRSLGTAFREALLRQRNAEFRTGRSAPDSSSIALRAPLRPARMSVCCKALKTLRFESTFF